jgi:hypothetical protein
MKKFALIAMLLCSCFVFGCEKKKTDTKPGDKPAAGADDKKGGTDAGATTAAPTDTPEKK